MQVTKCIFPQFLYEGSTKYNNDIKVIKIGKTVKLIVNGTYQSLNKTSRFAKKRVWGEMTKVILQEKPTVENLLLLGMAGGTMIHFLNEKRGSENIKITSVEIDPVIVDLAKKYFGMDKVENNRIIVADAFEFVSDPNKFGVDEKFDCIVVDTYIGGEYPKENEKTKFFENIKKMLNESGLVVVNRIIPRKTPESAPKFKAELERIFENVKVKKVNCKKISDNFIFYTSR